MRGLPAPPPGARARGRADGFTDWLVGSAVSRRRLTDRFIETFESWGYGFVVTPLIEPLDTIAAGVGAAQQAGLFRFMDSDGALLALVGERTVSVARVVATQLHDGPFPLRLCYAGPVLRNQALNTGRRRESLQAGCELVGATGLAADAECIALAAAALERGGVHHVQVDVGHADFIPGLLESAGLDELARGAVLGALARRDLVSVEASLEGTDVADAERRLLLAFPTLRGGREILDTAASGLRGDRPTRALQELAQLWDLLDAHAITDRVHLDLGAVRDWDYYTGPTFEVFSEDSGFALGSGGRYDLLLSRFGAALPATGFVLQVDRCNDSIGRREGAAPAPSVLDISWDADEAQTIALDTARRLRERGIACACNLSAGGEGVLHVTARGARWLDRGRDEHGSVDAAVEALSRREP
jgi:ATP phosphoribosyltransferase regulatory subunit